MALPFIGMLVGVDELVPTKAIYAVYDASNCGIAYVRGDGTFAVARQICFTRHFKDPSVPLHQSQCSYLPELMARSAMHYRRTNSKNIYAAETVQYQTQVSTFSVHLPVSGDPSPRIWRLEVRGQSRDFEETLCRIPMLNSDTELGQGLTYISL